MQDYVKLDIRPFENGAITIQSHDTKCYIFDNQQSWNYFESNAKRERP